MTKEERKEYMKAYRQVHKDKHKAYMKAYNQAHKEEAKAYYQAHKEEHNAYMKAWQAANKEQYKAYQKAYKKSDVNSLGKTKQSIRKNSHYYLRKYGKKIPGYEIHHCFTYDDPSKFIYCSKEMHLKIHQFLRDNSIDADSDHYDKIKHLLDESVLIYGV